VNALRSSGLASLLALAFVGFAAVPSGAAELQQILLDDGSSIVAEVRSLERGVYHLDSPTLGSIRIPQKRVRRIEPQRAAPPASSTPAGSVVDGSEVRDLQVRMLADPAMVGALLQLSELPEMRDVLADPEILRAVESGDLTGLEGNAKLQKLMGHPALQGLVGQAAAE
jgi:hypothetical protein